MINRNSLNSLSQSNSNIRDSSINKNINSNVSIKTDEVKLAKISKDAVQIEDTVVPSNKINFIEKRAKQNIYKKNRINCDSGKFQSCVPAAKRIMGDAPPAEFANMKKKDREKEGIKLLKKGADAEDDNAMIMLYDIFKKSRDPDEKALAKSYLAILVEKENPGGILRENMKLIPGNLITDVVSAVGKILGNQKVRIACKEIQRVAESQTLSFKDQTMAEAVLDRNACKGRKGT